MRRDCHFNSAADKPVPVSEMQQWEKVEQSRSAHTKRHYATKQLREGCAHRNVHLEGLLIERWVTEYRDVHFTAAHQAQHNHGKKLKRHGYFPFWLGFLGILRKQTG